MPRFREADQNVVPQDGFAYIELEKVAKLVTYLCGDSGSIVNGACWTADGNKPIGNSLSCLRHSLTLLSVGGVTAN